MIRPDPNVFDHSLKASPAKSNVMHQLRTHSATLPPSSSSHLTFSQQPTTAHWRPPHAPLGSALLRDASSTSCPRTPTGHKKRKDSSSTPHPHSAAYRRDLEKKLLEGDYLLFMYKPTSVNTTPSTTVRTTTSSSSSSAPSPLTGSLKPRMRDVPPIQTNATSTLTTTPNMTVGSTVTLGSLLHISSLILSSSTPRDSLFSPAASPHPSPMGPRPSAHRSPMGSHALSMLTLSGHVPTSGMTINTSMTNPPPPSISLEQLSSSPPRSPNRSPEPTPQKKTFTEQKWNAQQLTNASMTSVPFAMAPPPTIQPLIAPTPYRDMDALFGGGGMNGHRRAGSGFSSLGSNVSFGGNSSSTGGTNISSNDSSASETPLTTGASTGMSSSFTSTTTGGSSSAYLNSVIDNGSMNHFGSFSNLDSFSHNPTPPHHHHHHHGTSSSFSSTPTIIPSSTSSIIPLASGSGLPPPSSAGFTLHTRRRNLSGPGGLVSGAGTGAAAGGGGGGGSVGGGAGGGLLRAHIGSGMMADMQLQRPEPGAPVAAFNVFGNRLAHVNTTPLTQPTPMHQVGNLDEEYHSTIKTSTTGGGVGSLSIHSTPPLRPSSGLSSHPHSPLHVPNAFNSSALASALAPPLPASLPAAPITSGHFEWLYILGRGSFGEVWKVKAKETSDLVHPTMIVQQQQQQPVSPTPPSPATSAALSTISSFPLTPNRVYAIKKYLQPLTSMIDRRAFLRRMELIKQLVDEYNKSKGALSPMSVNSGGGDTHMMTASAPPAIYGHLPSPSQQQQSPAFHGLLSPPHTAGGGFTSYSGPSSHRTTPLMSPIPSASSSYHQQNLPVFTSYTWPPHLLQHYLVWQESTLLYTLTAYCEYGDLFQFFRVAQTLLERKGGAVAAAVGGGGTGDEVVSNGNEVDDEDMGVETSSHVTMHPIVSLPPSSSASTISSTISSTSSTTSTITASSTSTTKSLSEIDLLHILHQISSILSVFHRQNLLHNDIKPDQIFVRSARKSESDTMMMMGGETDGVQQVDGETDYPYTYVLGDLGSIVDMSEWCEGDSEGDGSYLAPEALNPTFTIDPITHQRTRSNITAKVDMYALGVSIYTLITGEKFRSSVLQYDIDHASSTDIHLEMNSSMQDSQQDAVTTLPASVNVLSGGASTTHTHSIILTPRQPHSADSTPSMARPRSLGLGMDLMSDGEESHNSNEFITPTARERTIQSAVMQIPMSGGGAASFQVTPATPLRGLTHQRPLSNSPSNDSITSLQHAAATGFNLHASAVVQSSLNGGVGSDHDTPSPLASPLGRARPRGLAPSSLLPSSSALTSSTSDPHQPSTPSVLRDNEVLFTPAHDLLTVSPALHAMVRRLVSRYPHVRPSSEELKEWTRKEIQQRR